MMDGKEFESHCMDDFIWSKRHGIYSAGRYGVQCVYKPCDCGKPSYRAQRSLPDFEGVKPNARQFIFDAKVVSLNALELRQSHTSERQISHMLDRSAFGVPCFFLIHFNKRELKRTTKIEFTVAVPVYAHHPIWMEYENGTRKSINREDAIRYGYCVPWWRPPKCKKDRPNIIHAVECCQKEMAALDLVHQFVEMGC